MKRHRTRHLPALLPPRTRSRAWGEREGGERGAQEEAHGGRGKGLDAEAPVPTTCNESAWRERGGIQVAALAPRSTWCLNKVSRGVSPLFSRRLASFPLPSPLAQPPFPCGLPPPPGTVVLQTKLLRAAHSPRAAPSGITRSCTPPLEHAIRPLRPGPCQEKSLPAELYTLLSHGV